MMSPRISVALATYNGEKFLKEQLESLAAQTVHPLELVVCDDGSADSTLEILREFASTAAFPVRIYINDINLGYADNFLKAAGFCQGDWIAFCDQDDVWLPRKLECVVQTIQRYPGDELLLVGHTSLMANANLEQNGQRLPDFRRNAYIKRATNFGFFCVVGFSMTCRAWLVKEIDASLRPTIHRQNPAKPPGHDQWIGLLANVLGDMAYISEPLAIWRRHESSLTRPPGQESLVDKARIAKSARKPDPYVLLGNMATEAAESIKKIANNVNDTKVALRLSVGAASFGRLAANLHARGDLYSRQRRLDKILAFGKLLVKNAYMGPKMSSLGWKSLAKDAAFAFGALG